MGSFSFCALPLDSISIDSISLETLLSIAVAHPIHVAVAVGVLSMIVCFIVGRRGARARARARASSSSEAAVQESSAEELTQCGAAGAQLAMMIAKKRNEVLAQGGGADLAMPSLPILNFDDELESTGSRSMNITGTLPAIPVLFDDHAFLEEPTRTASFAVSAAGATDRGQQRKKNEDSFLVSREQGLFVIADGMGGHHGGAVASELAVRVIGDAFAADHFDGPSKQSGPPLPTRATKLARAIQMANHAIRDVAHSRRELAEMGTTVVAALFAPQKGRLYIGHVGDSRCYRLRHGQLQQMTQDHTMATLGVQGPGASQLARAVGPIKRVPADIVVAQPEVGDVYLLCSDGVSKMLTDDVIRNVLLTESDDQAVAKLIDLANESGGGDNITAVLVAVHPPTWTPFATSPRLTEYRA